MKLFHYNNCFSNEPIHVLVSDFGQSCTDKTFFRPDISSTRAFLGTGQGSNRVGLYDFPDGNDDGTNLRTVLRNPGLDITEIDAIGQAIKSDIEAKDSNKKAKDSKDKKIKNDKDLMEALSSSVKSIAQNLTPKE